MGTSLFRLGAATPAALKLGAADVARAYLGSTLLYDPTVAEPDVAPLDGYTTALTGAWGPQLLLTDYAGPLMQVRRSTDNAVLDIGTVDGVLDTAALLAFAGAGSAFVSMWYDQSGQERHRTQTTDAAQAVIVASGVLKTDGLGMVYAEYPAGDFDACADPAVRDLPLGDFTLYAVHTPGALNGADVLLSWSGTDDLIIYPNDEGASRGGLRIFWRDYGGNKIMEGAERQDGVRQVLSLRRAGGALTAARDGVPVADVALGAGVPGPFTALQVGASEGSSAGTKRVYSLALYAAAHDDVTRAALDERFASAYGVIPANVVARNGVWTWFNDPRAIYDPASDRTFVGSMAANGGVQITQVDHASGVTTTTVLRHPFDIDDHDNPALYLRSDGRLLACYSTHNDAAGAACRISTNPGDATSWGTEQTFGPTVAYANLCHLSAEGTPGVGRLYWFFRRSNLKWCYRTSDDEGATWAAEVDFTPGGARPYPKFWTDGVSRIDMIWTDEHPNPVATNSVYHCYYEGGNVYRTDGTLISALGVTVPPTSMQTVFNSPAEGVKAWVWDLWRDGTTIYAAIATFPTPASDHRYRLAEWNGTAWSHAEVCTAGGPLYAAEAYYSGGIAIADANTVYVVRQVDGDHRPWRYTRSGAVWTGELLRPDMAGGSWPAFRPYVIRDGHADLSVLWCRGRYTTYENYRTNIETLPEVAP